MSPQHIRPLFESCHPPELIDDIGEPICLTTEPPTMSPTVSINDLLKETESPTNDEPVVAESTESNTNDTSPSLLYSLFKSREHETIDTTLDSESSGNRFLLALTEDHAPSDETFQAALESSNTNVNLLDKGEAGVVSKGVSNAAPTVSPILGIKMCPTWGPSIVPRQHEDISLNDDFTYRREESGGLSWKAKYTDKLQPGRALHTQHQLVHLEGKHYTSKYDLVLPSVDESKNSRLIVIYGHEVKPLRLRFDTTSLLEMLHELSHNFIDKEQSVQNQAKLRAYIEDIFPAVANVWADVLSMYQSMQPIVPKASVCGVHSIPEKHFEEGVSNADVVLYVAVREQTLCTVDSKPVINVCHFDQNMRPLIGSLSICLESMGLKDRVVEESEMLRHIASTKALVGKFLGLSPSLFNHFRDPATKNSWGGRYVNMSCDESGEKRVHISNTIQQQSSPDGEVYWEISTPTVKQVVRNHFDCQSLTGARLNPPIPDGNGSCMFSTLNLRYHFDEEMTSLSPSADSAFRVSPLSLSILEDSSWYKANFTVATTPSFGRAAGCGFVYERCIAKGKVPYSNGYFCDTLEESRLGCDFNHRNKAACDLHRQAKPPANFQYFHPENSEFGSVYKDVDYCPMRSKHLASCSSSGTKISSQFKEEFFDENSRCYETDAGAPICLETVCNSNDKSLSFIVEGRPYQCRYHGEEVDVGLSYSVFCPRLAAVCPDLVCPSDCSGRGVCDYCKEVPQCICDNPFDDSAGCWDS